MKSSSTVLLAILAGMTIIGIAIGQFIANGHVDSYLVGALLALALGGGVGRVADNLVKGYVRSQITEIEPPQPPSAPAPPGEANDEKTA